MIYLLVVHIVLGGLLLLSVLTRALAIILKKITPQTGRFFVGGLGLGLVTSGAALEIVAKQPLTGACLFALFIVFSLLGTEFLLQYLVGNRSHADS